MISEGDPVWERFANELEKRGGETYIEGTLMAVRRSKNGGPLIQFIERPVTTVAVIFLARHQCITSKIGIGLE